MNPLAVVKFVGAWACIVAAVVLLLLGHGASGQPGVLALLAVAFAMAPVSW